MPDMAGSSTKDGSSAPATAETALPGKVWQTVQLTRWLLVVVSAVVIVVALWLPWHWLWEGYAPDPSSDIGMGRLVDMYPGTAFWIILAGPALSLVVTGVALLRRGELRPVVPWVSFVAAAFAGQMVAGDCRG